MWVDVDQTEIEGQRNDILDKVAHGLMKPAEAEEWAKNNGQSPFASTPAEDAFDPMQKRQWSLLMAVKWIATRDISKVRESDNEYRAECIDWHSLEFAPDGEGNLEVRNGFFLDFRGPSSLIFERIGEAIDLHTNVARLGSLEDAQRDLWQRLRDGEIQCAAVSSETRKPVIIPAIEWSQLDLESERDGETCVHLKTDLNHTYKHLEFDREQVMSIWPVSKESSNVSRPSVPRRRAQVKTAALLAWPTSDGTPPATMTNAEIEQEIARRIGLGCPSKDTILRALGRRPA